MAFTRNYRQFNHLNITSQLQEDDPYYEGIVWIGVYNTNQVTELPTPIQEMEGDTYWLKNNDNDDLYLCRRTGNNFEWVIRGDSSEDEYDILESGDVEQFKATHYDAKPYYKLNFAYLNQANHLEQLEFTMKPWIANPQFRDISKLSERKYPYFFVNYGTNKIFKIKLSTEHNFFDFQEYRYNDFNYDIVDEEFQIEVKKIYVPQLDCFGEESDFYLEALIAEEIS